MSRDRFLGTSLLVLSLLSWTPHAEAATVVFADGFEHARSVEDLLRPGRWTYIQQENPGSEIEVSIAQAHQGAQSVRFFGHPSHPYGNVTKADLGKGDLTFLIGQTFDIETWFYGSKGADLSDLYLIDAECAECGTQSPGLRVRLMDGYPEIERGKLGLPTVVQRKVAVETGRWFDLRLRLKLGLVAQGHMTLWVDGIKVIDRRGTTVFPGGFVDSLQIGLTANGSRADAELFADDVAIRRIARRPQASFADGQRPPIDSRRC